MSSRTRGAKGADRRGARGREPDFSRPLSGAERGVEEIDASLLDIVDHVLTKGIVLTGDLVLGVADIDLVYLRLSAVLCAADRVLGPTAKKRRTPSSARPKTIAQRMGRPKLAPTR